MSETTLEQLRTRERTLELEAIAVRARVEEVRELIKLVEQQPQRRRRGGDSSTDSASVTIVNPPGRLPWDEDTAA